MNTDHILKGVSIHEVEDVQFLAIMREENERIKSHVSFHVSPPCYVTNFMSMAEQEIRIYPDETERTPVLREEAVDFDHDEQAGQDYVAGLGESFWRQ